MKFGDCCHRALSERRTIYEPQIPTLEIREEEIMGKYRGAPWSSRRLTAPSLPKLWSGRLSLKDRGSVWEVSQLNSVVKTTNSVEEEKSS